MARTISFFSFTADTQVRQLVPYNDKRTNLLIRNESGDTVYINTDEKEVLTKGYPLYVGDFIIFVQKDGDVTNMAIYVRALHTTANLRVIEEFEV